MELVEQLRSAFEIGHHPLTFQSAREQVADGYTVEHLTFESADGETVRGVLTRPQGSGPYPALLYIHAHGSRYDIGADELLHGRPALLGPLGPEFARQGFVTLVVELPAFGTRADPGESARAKAALWCGRSLAGQMIAEQAAAVDWLVTRPDVDPQRIGAFGISMGATFSFWLASVEPRLKAVAHLCAYADLAKLTETGAHDLHGIYMTVPGLLAFTSSGQIAGAIAPRPQLIGIGDKDPLTPVDAVDIALAETRKNYAAAQAADRLEVYRDANSGHEETAALRSAVFGFFGRTLKRL